MKMFERQMSWGNIYFGYWFGCVLMILGISEVVHRIMSKEPNLGDWALTVGTWGVIFTIGSSILAAIKITREKKD